MQRPSEFRRRELLQAALPGLFLASLTSSLRGQSIEQRPIKAGFLGGAHSHALDKWKRLRESPDFELVGMSEDRQDLQALFQPLGAEFLSPKQVCEQSEVVIVESAVADHARHTLLALEAGKHVHVEKPPTDNLPEFVQIVALARRQQRLLQVGYMWRYHPGFAKIIEAVSQGVLGEVYLVRGMINNQLAAERRPEWGKFAGGGMFELGAHLIDAIVRLLGEPTSVTTSLHARGGPADELRDNNVVIFEFPRAQGIVINTTLQPNAGRHREFEVFGTLGTATLRPIEPPRLEFDLAEQTGSYSAGVNVVPLPPYERYVGDFRALAQTIRGQSPPVADLDTELRVQAALLKASQMG